MNIRINENYKFYLFGCSHTAKMLEDCGNDVTDIDLISFCVGGNSNDKIIKDLKTQIYEITNGYTKKVNNVYFNIQFTYLNRVNFYSDLENKYIPFHSKNISNQPDGTLNHDYNTIYNNFYTNWLLYFFNEKIRLKELINECKLLKCLMDEFDIKYNWYLWAGTNRFEIQNSNKILNETKFIIENEFNNLGFNKFEDFWYFEDYAKKYKLRYIDKDAKNDDEHLTNESNKELFKNLIDKFYSKIN